MAIYDSAAAASPAAWTTALASSLLVYAFSLGVYRLFLSPLAAFPGPRLAALTQWVETYYELFYGDGGQFPFIYAKWHERYGPIVRINPWELHIQDSNFYETLYSNNRPSDKLVGLEHRFNNPMSAFATAKHSTHRQRRGALNPFFSRRRIVEHAPVIQARLNQVCERLQKEYVGTSNVLRLDNMWGCWTSDIVVGYCFIQSYDFVEAKDFRAPFTDAMMDLLEPVHFITQFPAVIKCLNTLPNRLIKWLQPMMGSVIDFNQQMEDQVAAILSQHVHEKGIAGADSSKTVFTALLESDLPPVELTVKRLQHEAMAITGAGIETTMRALSLTSLHVLINPPVLETLRAELDNAIPDPGNVPTYDALAQLPYLSACINEGLRLSYGTSTRLPRVLRDGPLPYGSVVIPVGTTVSMDNYAISHDEEIYPDSFTYQPQRWLNNPTAANGNKLSRYMTAFGRGTRSCVGMQLAYAELYVGLATMFRRFELELYETRRDAVDFHMDRFVPRPKPGTKGVRVLVKGSRS